jgi:multiple sugar transport system substrate-binding protein
MTARLRLALVAGPMYDHLYDVFDRDDVEVIVHADHPTLNRSVADLLSRGERIDVLATHSKYVPSQSDWLLPLDGLLEPSAVEALASGAVSLCRFEGSLWCVPRLVDVRVLWSRVDRVERPPDTWAELLESDAVIGFTGRESGAFGMFFELVAGAGGSLFDERGRPTLDTHIAVEALDIMRRLAHRGPVDLASWHYDEVDRALLDGRVDMAAAWPGGWGAIRDSALADVLVPSLYPAGSVRRVSYSGCHAWAIPRTCSDVSRAAAFVERLIGESWQFRDASQGSICANRAAMEAVVPVGELDARRLEMTQRTIAEAMITYPPMKRFPEIEDAAWSTIQRSLRGSIEPDVAARLMQSAAEEVLASE